MVRLPLPEGDYLFIGKNGEKVLIERKAVYDLYGSFSKGRVQNQLTRCLAATTDTYLLIEGGLKDLHGFLVAGNGRKLKIPFTALSNFLVTAQSAGVRILLSTSIENSANVIAALYDYYQKDTHTSMGEAGQVVRARHNNSLYQQQINVLMSLPGIGESLAKEALRVHFSPALAIQANLENVPGIGPKKREDAIKVLYSIAKEGK